MIRAEQTDFAAASGSACSTSLGVGGCRQSAAPLLLTEAFQGIPDIWQVSQHSLGVCVFGWATEAKEAASLHCYQWIRCSPCRGFISLEDTSYVLEPSPDHADGAHWIYTTKHLRLAAGTCGHEFNMSSSVEGAVSSPFRTFHSRVRVTLTCVSTLLVHVFTPPSQSSIFIFFFLPRLSLRLRQGRFILPYHQVVPFASFFWCTIKAAHIRGSASMRGSTQTYNA